MKLLLENWREYLNEDQELRSPAYKIPLLPPKNYQFEKELPAANLATFIGFYVSPDGFSVFYNTLKVKKTRLKNGEWSYNWFAADMQGEKATPGGVIQLEKLEPDELVWHSPNTPHGECLGAYRVKFVKADSGWGPLLYDIAIEIASLAGSGIMPDRKSITPDAQRLWHGYMERADVTPIPLDDLSDIMTPGNPKDNCNQALLNQFIDNLGFKGGKITAELPQQWNKFVQDRPEDAKELIAKSPFSKVYIKKNPDVLTALNDQVRIELRSARKLDEFVGKSLFGSEYKGERDPKWKQVAQAMGSILYRYGEEEEY